jgi:molybdate transport system regulatory protein
VKPKLRIWVVFGESLKLGSGRAELLELIDKLGSLRQAAAEIDMSYRHAWGYLRDLENAAGFGFVERNSGGAARSGLRLTTKAREFLASYRKFQRSLDRVAAREFAKCFGPPAPTRSPRVKAAPPRSATKRPTTR